ncbi:MAG TPA: phosphoribosyltransferase family protein [Clostridia bacterium]|nr:phosphoribosyltransferase family protein [Clostridia bacterium]
MKADDLLSLANARHGYFMYESGYHSDLWFDLETLCQRPACLRPFVLELCREITEIKPEVICGPLIEGAFVALVAALELQREFVYTLRLDESTEERMFAVAYELPQALQQSVAGRRVAVVNDVISAGSAVRGTLQSLRTAGAEVVGIASLVVLGDSLFRFAEQQGIVVRTLVALPNEMWAPATCPLCMDGIPLQKLAHH